MKHLLYALIERWFESQMEKTEEERCFSIALSFARMLCLFAAPFVLYSTPIHRGEESKLPVAATATPQAGFMQSLEDDARQQQQAYHDAAPSMMPPPEPKKHVERRWWHYSYHPYAIWFYVTAFFWLIPLVFRL